MNAQTVRSRKDIGWSWVALMIAFSLQTIVIGVCLSSGIFVIEYMEVFNSQHVETSSIASMQIGMAFIIGAPLSGLICERLSHRQSIIIGGIILSIGTFASSFANGVVYLYFTCGTVAGIGIGLIYNPSIGVIGQYFDKWLALALGITIAGGGCGAMVFPQIFHFLITIYGWRGALMVTSALMLNTCMLGALLYPNSSRMINYSGSIVKEQEEDLQNDLNLTRTESNLNLLKDVRFLLFFLNCFFSSFGSTAVFILLADYAIDCDINKELSTVLLSIIGLLSTVGRFAMAGIMHFFKTIKVLHLYTASTLVCGTAVLLIPGSKIFIFFVLFCAIFGFCYGASCSSSPVVAADFFGVERLTRVYSYSLIASGLGGLLGAPSVSWLYETTGNYHLSIVLSGATIVVSIIVIAPLYVTSCQKATSHRSLVHHNLKVITQPVAVSPNRM